MRFVLECCRLVSDISYVWFGSRLSGDLYPMPPFFAGIPDGRSALVSDGSGGTILGDDSAIGGLEYEFLLFFCVGQVIRMASSLNAVESV